jgi:hypothetical protein
MSIVMNLASSEYRVRGPLAVTSGSNCGTNSRHGIHQYPPQRHGLRGCKFMTMDLKDFYLGTPMKEKEYMRIHLSQIPRLSRERYIRKHLLVRDGVFHISSETPCIFRFSVSLSTTVQTVKYQKNEDVES